MKITKRTTKVRFWPKADFSTALLNVRYSSVSDQKIEHCDSRSGWSLRVSPSSYPSLMLTTRLANSGRYVKFSCRISGLGEPYSAKYIGESEREQSSIMGMSETVLILAV